jgi:PIN domain nuclease of toxin-antitoxin system
MTRGLLLDSHILLWLAAEVKIRHRAQFEIASAKADNRLYMSDISIWEMGVALHKKSFERRPDLQGLSIEAWFRKTTTVFGVQRLRISGRIALEAAEVPAVYGSGDPGDCFLIATARIRKLSLVTHDGRITQLASREPSYLTVVPC